MKDKNDKDSRESNWVDELYRKWAEQMDRILHDPDEPTDTMISSLKTRIREMWPW